MNMASYITLATACITIISAVAGLGWWLSNQFSHSHQLFYEAISELRAGRRSLEDVFLQVTRGAVQ